MLPFIYIPILLTGLSTRVQTTAFLLLFLLNILALYAGHTHRQDDGQNDTPPRHR
ncbi:hypothetical protein [Natrialba asiatica]|uniref:Uncharacterized protein n=1 Tax=Natrialba asiatica (strain ATCC 700177 / DSM 12278 / JCM 9576 / FERM P-10747 / NBRC 102637 / 172P1) TaxID=29540 RepID=M0AV23_NATA1|nr:hypothetical protein [Natrialba asiatica]ELZ01803.1 hypothetical protein C481_09792 [Natrialba asiatica DSM 12278]